MDTPERNQIGNPISKFEDSPVFNYINSLSPIKPVKSMDIAGTFNTLSFASLPSVFTSPHLNSQKGPRFFRRHDLSDLPKPDFSSDDQTKGNGVSDVAQNSAHSAGMQDGFDHVNFIRVDAVDLSNENSELPIELPQTLKYNSGSPDGKPIPISTHDNETNLMLETTDTPAALNHFVQETAVERCHSLDTEVELQRVFCHEQTKEETMGCDRENLISDAANLFIFDASNEIEASKGQDQTLAGHGSSCFTSFVSDLPRDRIDDLLPKESICNFSSSEKHEDEDPKSEVVEIDDRRGKFHAKQRFPNTFHIKQDFNDPSEKISEKLGNHSSLGCKQGGLPRRCLVFEMAGTYKRNLEEDHNSRSSISFPSDGELCPDNKKLFHPKPGASSSTRMLPGIGLHLNAIAVTKKDCKVMKHETLASGNQLVTMPSSVDSFHSLSEQGPVNKSLDMDTTTAPYADEILVEQDDSQLAIGTSEEFNHSTLKKKRRKLEHSEESGACKRCNCKKSKCLKLYCECFAAGIYCVEPCSCKECFNKPIHEDTVLATRKQIESRNPLAFEPKVIISSENGLEIGEEYNKTPASARHKRGCNCKKSSCLKKYCECYQGGVGCSINCRCERCKNTFGRKDGTEEDEPEEEESESCEKFGEEKIPVSDKAQNDEDKYSDHVLPTTPSLQLCRQSVQVLFSSRGKPPQSFVLSVKSSPQLHTTSQISKSDSFRPQPKFGKHFQIISEGETPDILRENCSPIRTLKIASPNRKRVSPPHNEFIRLSPSRRPTRKLVLQSIPSSLSLTHRERNLQ